MSGLRARLRPMGIGDILDETFRLYRENFVLFLLTVAVLDVPAQIINLLINVTGPTTAQLGTGTTADQLNATTASGGRDFLTTLISGAAGVFITAALAVVISNRYMDRTITVGDAYRATLNRFGPLIVATLWAGIRLILLGIACVVLIGIPFLIYFAVAWALIPQVVMLESVSGGGASGRSRELVRGYWWKTLGLYIVVSLLVGLLSLIPAAIVGAIFVGLGAHGVALLGGILGLIVTVLTRPIQTAATTLLFYDLKIRKEAFDLEAMVQQASIATPAAPPY